MFSSSSKSFLSLKISWFLWKTQLCVLFFPSRQFPKATHFETPWLFTWATAESSILILQSTRFSTVYMSKIRIVNFGFAVHWIFQMIFVGVTNNSNCHSAENLRAFLKTGPNPALARLAIHWELITTLIDDSLGFLSFSRTLAYQNSEQRIFSRKHKSETAVRSNFRKQKKSWPKNPRPVFSLSFSSITALLSASTLKQITVLLETIDASLRFLHPDIITHIGVVLRSSYSKGQAQSGFIIRVSYLPAWQIFWDEPAQVVVWLYRHCRIFFQKINQHEKCIEPIPIPHRSRHCCLHQFQEDQRNQGSSPSPDTITSYLCWLSFEVDNRNSIGLTYDELTNFRKKKKNTATQYVQKLYELRLQKLHKNLTKTSQKSHAT